MPLDSGKNYLLNFRLFKMILVCCVAAKGFYLKYDEMKTDANVQKWDVHVLTVSYSSLLIAD